MHSSWRQGHVWHLDVENIMQDIFQELVRNTIAVNNLKYTLFNINFSHVKLLNLF